MSDSLITPVELGTILGGESAEKVLEWRRTYDWPHVRIGRKFYWTPEQVEAIKRQHTVASTKAAPRDGRTLRSANRRRAS